MTCNSTSVFSRSKRLGPLFAVLLGVLSFLPASAPHLLAQSGKVRRKVLVMVQPEYPTVLKNSRFEGQVRLAVSVAANGTVSKVEIRGGNPMLAQYASEAVMKWKYIVTPAPTVEEVSFSFTPH